MSLPKSARSQELILMNSIIQEEATELAGWNGQAEVLSVYEAMQQLKDALRKQGKRYPLALILTYLLLAKAAGETTLQAITEQIVYGFTSLPAAQVGTERLLEL